MKRSLPKTLSSFSEKWAISMMKSERTRWTWPLTNAIRMAMDPLICRNLARYHLSWVSRWMIRSSNLQWKILMSMEMELLTRTSLQIGILQEWNPWMAAREGFVLSRIRHRVYLTYFQSKRFKMWYKKIRLWPNIEWKSSLTNPVKIIFLNLNCMLLVHTQLKLIRRCYSLKKI